MRVLLMLAGAVLVAGVVWASMAADVGALVGGAGWWALVVVAFPVVVGLLAWRFGEPYRG